jgi:hypothetical protein
MLHLNFGLGFTDHTPGNNAAVYKKWFIKVATQEVL